ncbi:sulfotransferase domain-containing protein [Jannaschia sp.]|nr:sulfotransferase domain-containing protein [Jannaschia sp.]
MTSPNFFILGTQKAGTTYLAHVLSQHADVFFTDPKEPLFLSRADGVSQKDYEKYLTTYFGEAKDQRWRGEGSTTYLQWPAALKRIVEFMPPDSGEDLPRFIVCLRQPVEKAISFFIHNWRRGRYAESTGIMDVLDEPITLSPYKSSCYADSIEKWFAHFPREQFLFLPFDELQKNPTGFVRHATDFLDISAVPEAPSKVINGGLPLVWKDDALTVKGDIPEGSYRPVFTKDELERLQESFLSDIARTETLTGLDLSSWRDLPAIAS